MKITGAKIFLYIMAAPAFVIGVALALPALIVIGVSSKLDDKNFLLEWLAVLGSEIIWLLLIYLLLR